MDDNFKLEPGCTLCRGAIDATGDTDARITVSALHRPQSRATANVQVRIGEHTASFDPFTLRDLINRIAGGIESEEHNVEVANHSGDHDGSSS